MEKTNGLKKVLWATVVFAEISAATAFFLNGKGTIIDELSGGQNVLFGVEWMVLAGLATYAVLRKTVSKGLIWLTVALSGLLLVFLSTRLADSSVSALGKELIVIDMLVMLMLIVGQVRSIRGYNQRKRTRLTSAV